MKIRLENVVKTFETFRAVRGVSLEIASGELVVHELVSGPYVREAVATAPG